MAFRSCLSLRARGLRCILLDYAAEPCPSLQSVSSRASKTFFVVDRKKSPVLRILWVGKTDNPCVSTKDIQLHAPRVRLEKPISLSRPRDAYPYFLARKAEIEALLRAGHAMYRVWEAYRGAKPPFPATYETFRTYCHKHGLAGLRRTPALLSDSSSTPTKAREPTPPTLLGHAATSPKIWPRITEKPREFIPRTEDDE